MRAIEVGRHGGPEVLAVVDRPEPVAGPGQVLVRNAYVGVNYVDLQHRAGRPYPVPLPLVPGTEAAGTVVTVGPGVTGFEPGQRVVHFGHLDGVYAELTAAPAGSVAAVPDEVGLDAAAALTLTGTTAYVLTRVATRAGEGDAVVVHSAAGGTGSAVCALAAAAGAHVVGVVSTRAKRDAALAAGAAEVVVGTPGPGAGDLAARVRAVTGRAGAAGGSGQGAATGRGADYVYDAGGVASLELSLDLLGDFGTLVLYGQSSGSGGQLDTARLSGLSRPGDAASLTVTWVAAGHYLREPRERRRVAAAVFAEVAAGTLRPNVTARLPLDQAAVAHRLLHDRATSGKILLTP